MAKAGHITPLLPVGAAEAGQKLINFLARRLGLQWGMLQRWIRTGQVRINGKRCKPFDLVQNGDQVRVPPFAIPLAHSGDLPSPPAAGAFLPLLACAEGIWAFGKPAGLAVQGGTNITDSVAGQLAALYADYAFKPCPAHRLDRDTSGILLVAASAMALSRLHAWFASGMIRKEYLAVVEGNWPHAGERLMRHYLLQDNRVTAYSAPVPGSKEALAVAKPLIFSNDHTVLQMRLLTGRKRQLRAQAAFEGHPIMGDTRYGCPDPGGLALHSMRIVLPNGLNICSLPDWAPGWGVEQVPEPLEIPIK